MFKPGCKGKFWKGNKLHLRIPVSKPQTQKEDKIIFNEPSKNIMGR